MKFKNYKKEIATAITLAIIAISLLFISPTEQISAQQTLSLIIETHQKSYYVRESILILGNLTSDGSPVNDALIAIQVEDPQSNPIYMRTIPIGNLTEKWAVTITQFILRDINGNPITKASINSKVRAFVTLKNDMLNDIDVVVTITVCDENLIPIYTSWGGLLLPGSQTATFSWQFQIPKWAKPGKALVFINAYNTLPKEGGIPYCPETVFYFDIVRNPEAGASYWVQYPTYNSSTGKFEVYLRSSPDRYTKPGTYNVYATARVGSAARISNSSTFQLDTYPCPPQAAFTYTPLQIYQNMTVTFDASSSSAEGFNDTIVRYEWTINDPYNPEHIIKEGTFTAPPSPTITHTFEYPGTFTVELNVTDNEGLWSTTSKPVIVSPEFGPTANFTWSPEIAIINQTITFDASESIPGWSAKTQEFSPIVTYTWDFGDGASNQSSDPLITHEYTVPGNYTVTLTVIDEVGRTDIVSKIIEIQNMTLKDFDVTGDGKIDIRDIFATAIAYGSKPGDPNWNPLCDVIKDGKIDIKDIFAIALNYGKDP